MTSHTVEIPADVKDNNTHTVRVQWTSTRPALPDEIELGRKYLRSFGRRVYEWDDVDRAGNRVTLTRFVRQDGQTIDLFETSYFTRVACLSDCAGYAQRYASVTDQDGVVTIASPYCGDCMISLRKSARGSGMTLNLSEPLRIGQH